MMVIKDIIESIENRLRELNEEIGALTAARRAPRPATPGTGQAAWRGHDR
jgi:hypothetical protein